MCTLLNSLLELDNFLLLLFFLPVLIIVVLGLAFEVGTILSDIAIEIIIR